jgi:hypothetical protein
LSTLVATAFVPPPDLPERDMMKRGKILRDPGAGPGLLMIEGRQYWFCLEGVWKAKIHPKPGLAVDVELDHDQQILAITAVSESQLAEEQTGQSTGSAKGGRVKILRKIAARCGICNLIRR